MQLTITVSPDGSVNLAASQDIAGNLFVCLGLLDFAREMLHRGNREAAAVATPTPAEAALILGNRERS